MLDRPTSRAHDDERRKTRRRIANVETTESLNESEMTVLHPLTPKYQPEKHAVYFRAIKAALEWTGDETVRNIALTGSYGVGKSSILRQVATDPALKVIQVSLSTLGFGSDGGTARANDVAPSDNPDQKVNPLRETKTNQIQKEIVKQLLYTQMPEKMPGSRYRRTSAFRPKREALFALATGLPIALAFFLLGWTAQLSALFTVPADWAIAANAGLAVIAALFVFAVRYVTHNKLRIASVSTGAATIQLSAASDTYFDEYLDEIVYFFEVVDADIIIFEDIDRFEDAHIFETLRELNTILNGAKQLDGRIIRFLYAIKDSIFEELGTRAAREAAAGPDAPDKPLSDAAMLEVARANRTKFFDLVIPVVPFVTHQSARELMANELDGMAHSISDDLIDLVAQHVPDMRLIKNIRNEFVIFREQVIEQSSLDLTDDALFAMVLYKSTHLSDFEQIKLGKSALDTLYRDSRNLVTNETARLNLEILDVRKRVRMGAAAADRAARLGAALDEHIDRLLGHFGGGRQGLQYDGESLDATDLRKADFWTKYAANPKDLILTYRNPWSGYGSTTRITASEVQSAVGEPMDAAKWQSMDRADAEKKISAARTDIEFLRRADMSDLMQRPDLKLKQPGSTPVSFAARAEKLLGSGLAVALVDQGYIDRYFTLYTSTFVGERVNANAMNFILKNVDTGSMDIYFPLSADEAKAVVRERPRLALREKSAYNLDFVDHLLADDAVSADTVLTNLRRGGDDEKEFLQAYLSSERDAGGLVRALAAPWPDVFTFVVDVLDLDDERRLHVVDAAFAGLSDGAEYTVSDGVATYFEQHHLELDAFTAGQSADTARRVAHVVEAADILIPDLAELGDQVRRAIVEAERFVVTRSNLLTAVAPSADLSLNALKASSKHVYRRVLDDIERYLDLLGDDEATITDPETFIAIVEDVAEAHPQQLDEVIRRSVEACRVSSLGDIESIAWPALAANGRFDATFADLTAYVDEFDLDAKLAVVLSGGSITTPDDLDEEAKLAFARKLLAGSAVLPAPQLRVSLLESLVLADHLAAEDVPAEPGEWIGRLIEADIIADDADSFALIIGSDWPGLEYAIRTSNEVPHFIDPSILPTTTMVRFLDSPRIDKALKAAVVERFEEFAGGREATTRMVNYALENAVTVPWGALAVAANNHVPSSAVLRLLSRFNSSVTLAHLQPILTALGGDYRTLLTANGKHPRFPNTPEVVALLKRLEALGTVSSITPAGSWVKANMKKP